MHRLMSFFFRLVPIFAIAIAIFPPQLEAGDDFANLPWHLGRTLNGKFQKRASRESQH